MVKRVWCQDLLAAMATRLRLALLVQVGQQWRDMTPEEKQPFIDECCAENRLLRQRLSSADPQQLLVRHEMWLQESTPGVRKAVQPSLILVHYLGDDAYQ